MRTGNKIKQWLMLLLCVVMAAGVLTQTAGAAEPTGRCTNPKNEGIEYFQPAGVLAEDANRWRSELNVRAVRGDDPTFTTTAGTVAAMEVEVINSNLRYQCTEVATGGGVTTFSCNSMPVNSVISGVYFLYKPDSGITEGTGIAFIVEEAFATNPKQLMFAGASVTMPPYPCARPTSTLERDFVAPVGTMLVFYTNGDDCGSSTVAIGDQAVSFLEQEERYAIVNILDTDTTVFKTGIINFNGSSHDPSDSRVMMDVSVDALYNFDFDLELEFEYKYNTDGSIITPPATRRVLYHHVWDPTTKTASGYIDSDGYTLNGVTYPGLNGLMYSNLPLTLVGGTISNLAAKEKDGWGINSFPPDADFTIRFWYENYNGTLGYENSVFHFTRNLNIQFSPTCKLTAPAATLYDPCQVTRQGFRATLPDPVVITGKIWQTDRQVSVKWSDDDNFYWDKDKGNVYQDKNYYFMTRKCVNATCDYVTSTSAYVQYLNMSDGAGSSRTYTMVGFSPTGEGTAVFGKIKPYEFTNKPFAITGVGLVADEPGTYVIYAFTKYGDRYMTVPNNYKVAIYVTINDKDQFDTCQTLANNGYFKALWNDCLSSGETQLMTFEQIPGKEEAWMENRSNHGVNFPYVQEWSYIPQKLQVASLNWKCEALASGGRPGECWCSPEGCWVPPYTKLTITSGSLYLEGYPKHDNYYVAYAREDTWNISHLFFSIQVKQCENKKIPDTGISLRSPLKVNARVDEATNYVFTGNSIRIPAIGLGMETPIPIVHVYYEEGSDGMKWDLSTLGNYVGELEGGSYIPYGGNSALTGHYFSAGVFKNLEHLNLEDEIIIFGNDGIKYTYKVAQKFIAQPEDVYEMFQQIGERSLTLVTCENYNLVTDEYERRYIVRAIIDSQEPYEVNW